MMQFHSSSVFCVQSKYLPCRSRYGRLLKPSCNINMTAAAMQHISGLSNIAAKYEAVLLDQFGVLHDGRQTYSYRTVEAVRALASLGIKVFIISNSSRRSSGTIEKLKKLGFDPNWFSGAVTSGDMAHIHLQHRPSPWWQGLGHRCIHFTWGSRGTISLDGLGLQVGTKG